MPLEVFRKKCFLHVLLEEGCPNICPFHMQLNDNLSLSPFLNTLNSYKFHTELNVKIACERRRISGGRFSPPKKNVCESKLQNDFCDVKIIYQKKSRTNSQDSCAAATYSRGEIMADALQHAFNKVCNVLGFDSLNTHQEKSIKYIVQEKKDIFVNLPTGFGKSLIYRALPLVYSCLQSTHEKNVIVVISPRNSLIKDQVLRLNSRESLPYLWLK